MNHYIDIQVSPDPEFTDNILMSALFSKLHRALVTTKKQDIGISFPDVDRTLGARMRIHGEQSDLKKLIETDWLKGMSDYTNASSILTVPENCKYRVVNRVQSKSSIARLYRRSIRKGWISEEEALKRVELKKIRKLRLPYLQIRSISSGQKFRIFINHGKIVDNPNNSGTFSKYGLSSTRTIPWF